ncbi:MAG: BON domain-containing protein [Chloroflexota bacterium]
MNRPRDEELVGGVTSALVRNGRINSADRIMVRAENGTIFLSGTVGSAEEKLEAQSAAEAVPGVRRVTNTLTVAAGGGVSDEELARTAERELQRAPDVAVQDLGVAVDDGIVHLLGHVSTVAQARAAEQAARSAKGVKEVVSDLSIAEEAPVEEAPLDDTTLANRIVDALTEGGFRFSSDEVRVADGVAFLKGYARTTEERDRATRIAEGVPGVASVDNRMTLARSEESSDPDERIIARVIHALDEDGRVSPSLIGVSASGGIVRLTGQVDRMEDQAIAAEVAARVPGVRRVINEVLLTDRTAEHSGDKGHPKADIEAWLREKNGR